MVAIPKPQRLNGQRCPGCARVFSGANTLYRHALKCRVGRQDRLGSRAKKVESDGFTFDSGLECAVYHFLKGCEGSGVVSELKVKPNVRLTAAGILIIPDFCAITTDTATEAIGLPAGLRYHEAKGFRTDVWRLKRRLWEFYGPAPMLVYEATGDRRGGFKITEIIVPRGLLK